MRRLRIRPTLNGGKLNHLIHRGNAEISLTRGGAWEQLAQPCRLIHRTSHHSVRIPRMCILETSRSSKADANPLHYCGDPSDDCVGPLVRNHSSWPHSWRMFQVPAVLNDLDSSVSASASRGKDPPPLHSSLPLRQL